MSINRIQSKAGNGTTKATQGHKSDTEGKISVPKSTVRIPGDSHEPVVCNSACDRFPV